MDRWFRHSRWFLWIGLALMLIGALDPMEGSVVIFAGSVVAALGAWGGRTKRRYLQAGAAVLIGTGVGLLFGMSALGGVGGTSGRSIWWVLLVIPYPVGWIVGLTGAVLNLRRLPRQTAPA